MQYTSDKIQTITTMQFTEDATLGLSPLELSKYPDGKNTMYRKVFNERGGHVDDDMLRQHSGNVMELLHDWKFVGFNCIAYTRRILADTLYKRIYVHLCNCGIPCDLIHIILYYSFNRPLAICSLYQWMDRQNLLGEFMQKRTYMY